MSTKPEFFYVLVGARAEARVTTVEELDAVLDGFDEPTWIGITGPGGVHEEPHMSLGVGREEFSFVNFGDAYIPGEPGPEDEDECGWDDGVMTWGWSERGRAIPPELARQVARDFVTTGERPALPNGYEWQDDADV